MSIQKSVSFDVSLSPGDLRVNNAWRATGDRHGRKMRMYKTAEYRQAQAKVCDAARKAADGWTLEGPIHVHLTVFCPRLHRTGAPEGLPMLDVDACTKGVLDALETARVLEDDAQVMLLTSSKVYQPAAPGIYVYASELDETSGAELTQRLLAATQGKI